MNVIIGHAQHVMRVLGRGCSEADYCNALQTALNRAAIHYRREVICPIFFMGEIVGHGRADFVIDKYVVEVKANKLRVDTALPQLTKYIKSLSKAEKKDYVGVIINFNQNTGKVDVLKQKPIVTSKFFKKK